jgi:hypothetical protein
MRTDSKALPAEPRQWAIGVLVSFVAVATTAAVIATGGDLVVALVPLGAVLALYVLYIVPLRYPALVLLFLGMTLESPGSPLGSGLFVSPIHMVGWLLLTHWNGIIGVGALVFSGLDLFLIYVSAMSYYRRASGSRIDGAGFVDTPGPLRRYAWVTVCGALFVEAWGLTRGGFDFANSLWQVEHAAYLPLFFLAFNLAFKGPDDLVAVGKVILGAAAFRAGLCVWIRNFVKPNDILAMPTATTHDDSLLFAGAFALCLALTAELPTKKHKRLCLVMIPLLLWAMMANNRRIVWVELALALGVLFVVMPATAVKRKIVRWATYIAPVVLIYLAVGWNQSSPIFKGAAVVRSIVEPDTDGSSKWREEENLDLVVTLQSSPLLGLGYGHKYIGPLPIEDVYVQEHFLPHNSMLGIWAFGGVVGFGLNWTFLMVGAFMASRAYKLVTRPLERVAALWVLQMLMIYMDHAFGDIGLGCPTGVLLVGSGLAMVGKLASASGGWPTKVKSSSPQPPQVSVVS